MSATAAIDFSVFRDPERVRGLVERIGRLAGEREINLMEVCGTHTMSIGRYGFRSVHARLQLRAVHREYDLVDRLIAESFLLLRRTGKRDRRQWRLFSQLFHCPSQLRLKNDHKRGQGDTAQRSKQIQKCLHLKNTCQYRKSNDY